MKRDRTSATGDSATRFRGQRCRVARPLVALLLLTASVALGFPLLARSQGAPPPTASSRPTAPADPRLTKLLEQLGDADFRARESATRALLVLGPEIVPALRDFLEGADDPEVAYRLRYILENIVPPDQAVLVQRADGNTDLHPGDLITHVNGRRVRQVSEVDRFRPERFLGPAVHLRVFGPGGPREVGAVLVGDDWLLANYRIPRGPQVAAAVRAYADGFAERSYETLEALGAGIPDDELSALLRARIAYTAGDAAEGLRLVNGQADVAMPQPVTNIWLGPSRIDLAGPGRGPFHFEWTLWTDNPTAAGSLDDPDIRVQRVLVPAGRKVEALTIDAGFWWTRYRAALGESDKTDRIAGNMLAVSAWMLNELELVSECVRLVEPRSEILRGSPGGPRKWLRVNTDAWLPFLRGDAGAAVDLFFTDAVDVLQGSTGDPNTVLRNPRVAATIALFAYQNPEEPRLNELLLAVNRSGHPALGSYARWMHFALHEKNFAIIREHTLALLPNTSAAQAEELGLAAALLEYVQATPDDAILQAAAQRAAARGDAAPVVDPGDETPAPPTAAARSRAQTAAIIEALRALASGGAADALTALQNAGSAPGVAVLRATANFLRQPPAGAARHPALHAPLLVVPLGAATGRWIVLARDQRLLRYDSAADQLTPLEGVAVNWFPSPTNWPWLGREESSGRVWRYDRRRVVELESAAPLRLNIKPSEIAPFDQFVGPRFSSFATLAAATPPVPDAENGEFLRSELSAHREFVSDPDLPEVGALLRLPEDPRVALAALRGGGQLLLWLENDGPRQAWSSDWIARQIGRPALATFYPHAVPRGIGAPRRVEVDEGATPESAVETPPPVVFLCTAEGLLRFDFADERVTPLALPGTEPQPALVPESTPYDRRDPRFVYCARRPAEGGAVFRVHVADNHIEPLDLVNHALPDYFYDLKPRAELRGEIDQRLATSGAPPMDELIADAATKIELWRNRRSP